MVRISQTLLIVEDNKLDIEKIERTMKQLEISRPTVHASDGLDALDIMRGTNGKEPLRKPFIVLLDLNMPKMDGIELLAEMRKDEQLKNTPVVVLTTSSSKNDIESAYDYNVAGYILKPVVMDEMLNAMNSLNAFWDICEMPVVGHA